LAAIGKACAFSMSLTVDQPHGPALVVHHDQALDTAALKQSARLLLPHALANG
jgi:hypothetical protein